MTEEEGHCCEPAHSRRMGFSLESSTCLSPRKGHLGRLSVGRYYLQMESSACWQSQQRYLVIFWCAIYVERSLLIYISHHAQAALTFPSERDCGEEDGKEWAGPGLVPNTMCPGWAFRPRLDLHSGCISSWWSWTCLSPWQIWVKLQMRGDNERKTLQRAGMGGECLGELPRAFTACICLFVGKQHLKKSKQRGSHSFSDLWKNLHISAQKCAFPPYSVLL